jgi:pyridoxal phosphate enzyme (YggS family)
MSPIASNLQAVHQQIVRAANAAERPPDGVRLLAVSKTFGADAVLQAWRAGQLAFGENYLQEALDKIAAVAAAQADAAPEWHFIGPIQSNKTRPIAEHFAWVHSVEREKIARRLSEQRPAHLPALNLCLQVNVSGEASKSGAAPEQAADIARAIAALPRVRLRGLMAIPAPSDDPAEQRAAYRRRHGARYAVDGHVGRSGGGHCGRGDYRSRRQRHLRPPPLRKRRLSYCAAQSRDCDARRTSVRLRLKKTDHPE